MKQGRGEDERGGKEEEENKTEHLSNTADVASVLQ